MTDTTDATTALTDHAARSAALDAAAPLARFRDAFVASVEVRGVVDGIALGRPPRGPRAPPRRRARRRPGRRP